MICPSCKFDVPDRSVVCLGCGRDLRIPAEAKKRVPRGRQRGGRRVAMWLTGVVVFFVIVGIAGVAALNLATQPEPVTQDVEPAPQEQERPGRPAPAVKKVSPPARLPAAERRALVRVDKEDDALLGNAGQWRAESYGARLSLAANFVTSRATVASTEKLKDAAVYIEGCISRAIKDDTTGHQRVAPVAAVCLSEIVVR